MPEPARGAGQSHEGSGGMVRNTKLHYSGYKFFHDRLSTIICLCLSLLMLAACGDLTSTAPPQTTLAQASPPAPTTAGPATAVATTAPVSTPTLGNPVGGSTPGA